MKNYILVIFTLSVFLSFSSANAEESLINTEYAKLKINKSLRVWESQPVQTDNSGTQRKLLLGTTHEIFYCSLAYNEFYRHGNPNRGALTCAVHNEGANWYLTATGPTHEPNTTGGNAYAICKAICISK